MREERKSVERASTELSEVITEYGLTIEPHLEMVPVNKQGPNRDPDLLFH